MFIVRRVDVTLNGPSLEPHPVGPVVPSRKLREYALVLQSMQIAHDFVHDGMAWRLVVAPQDLARALEAIRLYEVENRDWPPRPSRERLPYALSIAAPAVFLVLALFFFFVTGPASSGSAWFARGTSLSGRVLHGEPWRAITALTLHADPVHIAGNAISGTIFLSAVNRRLGDGRGPLLAVVAGALGNFANALYYRNDAHGSIGASTAVFALVGVLAATQLAADRRAGAITMRDWAAPLVGGLALLGMLGASPHTDVMAHLFGLVAGVAVGVPVAFAAKGKRTSRLAQAAYGVVAVAMVLGAWGVAMGG